MALIEKMDAIITDYQSNGYVMTVRQLYYALVSADIISNTMQSYKNMAGLVNDARYAGLLDWEGIEDRTRSFISRPSWNNPQHFLDGVLPQYHTNQWEGQEDRLFVIIEKEALVGVIEGLCRRYDVPVLAARGYPSVSVMRDWVLNTVVPLFDQDLTVTVLHFGDHDPSGLDMTRDLDERIDAFCEYHGRVTVDRMALNMEQIDELKPPPNPAKVTDSRFTEYARLYGDESWELDAVGPKYLNNLVETRILEFIDQPTWVATQQKMDEERKELLNLKNKL